MSPARPFLHRTNGPLEPVLVLFSSVTLGITLLVLLFVYASIGSAGILYPTGVHDGSITWAHEQVRQWRGLEMTEFEWFHWWPFDLLIGLICTNVTIATLRRIPLNAVNTGVWLIHSGILTLAAGSVLYFSTKVEGDAPVVRRQVVITLPGGARDVVLAIPGNALDVVDADGSAWRFSISSVDPHWSLLSGEDAGQQTFAVNVSVESPDGTFIRQLLDGYPQYTEDVIRTGDPEQPFQRAVKAIGRPLLDESLALRLEPAVQTHFYLANHIEKSWALYLREAGDLDWVQRPIEGLPLYNDYVGSVDEVWLEPGHSLPLDPIDVAIPAFEAGDPLPDRALRATAYLRYAEMEERRVAGGERLDPTVRVRLREVPGGSYDYELVAFDPVRSRDESGDLTFQWVDDEAEREALAAFREPTLTIAVPDAGIEPLVIPVRATRASDPELGFTPIEGTAFEYRVEFLYDELEIPGGATHALAGVRFRSPTDDFERYVVEDARYSVDKDPKPEPGDGEGDGDGHVEGDGHEHVEGDGHAHGDEPESPHGSFRATDPRIVTSFDPGAAPAPVTIAAGPADDDLHVLVPPAGDGEPTWRRVRPGDVVTLFEGDQGRIDLEILGAFARGTREVRPAVVPPERRERDVREQLAMIKVHVPGASSSVWVPFHHYPVRDRNETLRRFAYRPVTVRLDDGRRVELILSRERRPLPHPVRLDDFQLTTHVGGFTGRVSSIRDWTSVVSFADDGGWSETSRVSMNKPGEHGRFWFFQAEWDPPSGPRFSGDASSAGLNYTVLGVGNREGVGLQLFGCTVAVIGMIYAFYVKPYIRRRQRIALASVPASPPVRRAEPLPAPRAMRSLP